MRTTLRRHVATTVAGAALITVATALPAAAHTNVCIGQGKFVTAARMYYVGFGGPTTTTFTMVFPTTGTCVSGPTPEFFNGTVAGNCGLATGAGVTTTGHVFTFTWVGSTLTFQGQVQGDLHIVEDPTFFESCTSGASHFAVSGGLLLSHT